MGEGGEGWWEVRGGVQMSGGGGNLIEVGEGRVEARGGFGRGEKEGGGAGHRGIKE